MKFFFLPVSLFTFLVLNTVVYGQKKIKSQTTVHKKNTTQFRNEDNEIESAAIEEKHRRSVWYSLLQQKHPDYFAVRKLFENYFKNHNNENSKAKEVCASWLKTQVFYLDNTNRVMAPPNINFNLIHSTQTGALATVTDSMAGDWHMLGPRNTFQTGYSGVGNRGGYVSCARIDPTNTNKLFIGFTTGGLWVSADGGNIWQLTDANLPDREYIDIDVCKANNLYVYAISSGNNAGAVIKSTDGGLTWSSTALNATNYPGVNAYDIAVSPTNPNIVIARWGTNLYRTTDGGTTWTIVLNGLKDYSVWGGTNENAEMLDFHATDSNVVYHLDRNDNQNYVTLYRSSNAGASFNNLGNINIPVGATGTVVGWAKILTATNNPTVVYVAMGTGSDAYGHHAVQLFKLDATTGAVLQTRVDMISASPIGVHHGDVAMDLNNDNNIVWGTYSEQNVHYSTDNGATFTTSATTVHSDLRALSMVSGNVLLGTDGEATYSTNNGASFTSLSAAISNHELWGFGAAFKSDVLGAGCNHGPLMIRENEGSGGWYNAMGADQGNSDVNPLDGRYLYSQGYDSYHTVRTGVHTMNSGAGGQEIDPGGIYSYFNTMHWHPNLYYTFITHQAGGYPTGNPNLATWKKSLIRSDNNGVTINKIVKTFTTDVFREDICMTNPYCMYVVEGLSNNKLWKTTDGGVNWTDITPSVTVTGTGVRNISDIAVSDINPNEIWVSYSGVQNTCQALHSADGINYTNLTTAVLTNFPVTKIIFQRGTNGGVYVGNKSGIFYRNNSMNDWQKIGNGMPMADVRFLFINYYKGKLMVGSSRGAWDHDLYEHSNPMAQISADKDSLKCSLDKVQFRDYSVVKSGASVSYSWSFPGGSPSSSTTESPLVGYASPGTYNVSLTVTDQYGSATQTLTNFIKVTASECAIDTIAGKSLSLPGTNDIGSIASLPLNTNTLTITAWVKPSAIQADFTGIITHGSRTGLFVKNGTNELGYMWGNNQWGWNSGLTLPANQWSHIAWVITAANTTVYVNGIAAVNNVANSVIDLSTSSWSVGEDIGYGSARNFNGEVEELCFYNRSLAQNEVREKMHLTRPASETGLIGYYQFNESSAGTFYNKVSGGTNMVNSGGVQVTSTAPVASGASTRINITTLGTYDFGAADAVLTFAKASGTSKYPGGDVIVYKLNSQPSGLPAASLNYAKHYWIIRNFGTNATVNTLQTLTYRNTGFSGSGNSLFKRNANYFGATWGNSISSSTTASSSANGGTQVFNNLKSIVTTFGQFTIGSTSVPTQAISINNAEVSILTPSNTEELLKVSPNPAKDMLNFIYNPGISSISNGGKQLLTVYDFSGAKVISKQIDVKTTAFSGTINVSQLSQGSYILKIGNKSVGFVKL